MTAILSQLLPLLKEEERNTTQKLEGTLGPEDFYHYCTKVYHLLLYICIIYHHNLAGICKDLAQ